MKAVISTLMVTVLTGVIVIKFFFSSLLTFFGYAVLPIESLKSLTHSKKIVQKMQHRNKVKIQMCRSVLLSAQVKKWQ